MTDPAPRRKRRRRRSRRARPAAQLASAVESGAAQPVGTDPSPTATIAPAARAESPAKPPRKSATPRRPPRLETSAGGIVVRLVDGQPRILLIRDSYRNWGFPKGHLEQGETAADAALREVREETGLGDLALVGAIDTIDWLFRFRGRLVHKTCHFFLMHTRHARTRPQRSEGITACRWVSIDEAETSISYANARDVLRQARAMLVAEGLIRDPVPTVDAGA